jgi:hypothetical protein
VTVPAVAGDGSRVDLGQQRRGSRGEAGRRLNGGGAALPAACALECIGSRNDRVRVSGLPRAARPFRGRGERRLPAALLDQTTAVLTHGSERLTIRIAHSGELRVLLLGRRDTRLDRLTVRERATLDRVAR